MSAAPYVIAVRSLCEFTARHGDLDQRFTPSATALEGIAGHAVVAARRGPRYRAELSLSGAFENLLVRGRADGYDPARNLLEEVKTYRGDLALMPDNRRALHWAQAKVYGALLCRQLGLAEVQLALVYFDVTSQTETVLQETHSAAALQQVFEAQCRAFLAWAAQETAHRARRDAALVALRFPHRAFRAGQRELSEAVYRAAVSGRCLLAQAPTGIGKTIATLFAQLKAAPGQRLDKVFYLAAKTPGRALALDGLATLRGGANDEAGPVSGVDEEAALPGDTGGLPLRVLELVARDKACEHPDKACHGDSCPLAKGFYDRLPQARSEAIALGQQGHAGVRGAALAHQVCPYYLAQELVRWSDVVVGDYNYWFDFGAMLHGMTVAEGWRVGVLVDEAHNLVDRARRMYSAELTRAQVKAVRRGAPEAVKRRLGKLDRCWKELIGAQDDAYAVHPEPPGPWLDALQRCISAIGDHLELHPVIDAALLRFYFDALHFTRVHERFDVHSLCDLAIAGDRSAKGVDGVLCLRNLVPAPFLKPRFEAAHSSTLFSATLSPPHYYRDLLGLPEATAEVDVVSPFEAGQLTARIEQRVSTRFAHRGRSLQPIVDLMARQHARAPGNYLAFFSSFDYLQQVAALLRESHPAIETWAQSRQMDEAARQAFLDRFRPDGRGIAFAVLGGAFAEGIDLPGRRLIGAFVATLGLPQLNPVNEQLRQRMQTLFGAGYDYAYLFPGLQKVVQAAGRVIRSPSDRGTLLLIDDRYARPEVRRLLPSWWQVDGAGLSEETVSAATAAAID